jgi:uncharacterized protein YdeI (YjbR/CyaY-like superfamily)
MPQNILYVKSRDSWRAWLQKNHSTARDVWLIYYKVGSGKPRIPYEDAVEEALCFGWIDGQVKRIDSEKHMQRFSPRRKGSVWAESNIKRVRKLMRLGKMAPAGLEAFRGHEAKRVPQNIGIPNDVERALKARGKAWESFQNWPPSHRKHFLWWIISSRTQETRERRIREVAERAAENRKLGWERAADRRRN